MILRSVVRSVSLGRREMVTTRKAGYTAMTLQIISVIWIRIVLNGLSPRERKKNQRKKREIEFVDIMMLLFSCRLKSTTDPEVKEGEQEQNDKDHERKHGREAVSIKLESGFIHGGNENIRFFLRAALCDQVDDIEFVECPNHAEDDGGS